MSSGREPGWRADAGIVVRTNQTNDAAHELALEELVLSDFPRRLHASKRARGGASA